MTGQSYTRVRLVALAPSGSPAEAEAMLDLLHQRYGDVLAARLPAGTVVRWHARSSNEGIDHADLTLENEGYQGGDPDRAAAWVVACCRSWLDVLRASPLTEAEMAAALPALP